MRRVKGQGAWRVSEAAAKLRPNSAKPDPYRWYSDRFDATRCPDEPSAKFGNAALCVLITGM
jgi:hypothetical protein